jgi:hypothetical protein
MLFNDCGSFGAAGLDRWNLSPSPHVTIILPHLPFGNGLTVRASELFLRIITYYLLFAPHAIFTGMEPGGDKNSMDFSDSCVGFGFDVRIMDPPRCW